MSYIDLCKSCFKNLVCDMPHMRFNCLEYESEFRIIDNSRKETTIKDSGERTEFPSGAVRDMHTGKGRYDLLPWNAIDELAKHCELGAEKYGERNCEKGIFTHSLLDSAIRHLSCYMRGQTEENHLRAAMWNVAMAIEMELNNKDMQDIPNRIKGEL